ncbi:MAG: hypothetical protein ACJ73S_29890 [Mycobacteriales bacterium]
MTGEPYFDEDEARVRALFDDVIGHDLPVVVDVDTVVVSGRNRSRLRQTALAALAAVALAGGMAAGEVASRMNGPIGTAGSPGGSDTMQATSDDTSTPASRQLAAEMVRLTAPARSGQVVTDSQVHDITKSVRLAQLDVTLTYYTRNAFTEDLHVTVARPGPGVTSLLAPCDEPDTCVVDRTDQDGTISRVYPYDPAATGPQPGWLAVVVKADGLQIAVSDTALAGSNGRPRYSAAKVLELATDVRTTV